MKPIPFEESLVYKILKERWSGRDMEQYFVDKSNEHLEKLKKEIKP